MRAIDHNNYFNCDWTKTLINYHVKEPAQREIKLLSEERFRPNVNIIRLYETSLLFPRT